MQSSINPLIGLIYIYIQSLIIPLLIFTIYLIFDYWYVKKLKRRTYNLGIKHFVFLILTLFYFIFQIIVDYFISF